MALRNVQKVSVRKTELRQVNARARARVCWGSATPLMLYTISVWPRSSILTKRNPKVNSDYVFISRTCLTTHEYGIHELTYCLLKEKDSLDCVRVVYFSDSSVRNSVFRTVSITVSYSSRTCRTTKSSW